MLTPEEVRRRVEELAADYGDAETAHMEEDEIRRDVLEAIRDGRTTDPAGVAREALRTKEIDFPRYYA